MGSIFTVFDNCGAIDSPAMYMEEELQRSSRIKQSNQHRKKMDVMGVAMSQALHDIKHAVGLNLSDTEEKAEEDQDYKDMTLLKQKYMNVKRRDSDTSVNTAYKKRRDDIYQDYLDRKRKEDMIRLKAKQNKSNSNKMKNRKMMSNRKLNELDRSSSNVNKVSNPMGTFNPTGGIMASRKFGANNQKSKVFQMGKTNKLLLETEENEDTYDDNLSQGDVFVVGGQSEYDDNQSFLSIKQYDSSADGESIMIGGNDSDSMSYLDIKKTNSSQWDDSSSQFTSSNVIVMGGDGDSSYNGNISDTQSETTIKQIGGNSQLGSRLRSRQGLKQRGRNDGSSHVIVDDYQSQGYGMDSEMDAQSLVNGSAHNVYIEGDSDIIDEADDEMNHSFEKIRQTMPKKPKSLDDFDGEEEEEVNQEDFLKGLLNDQNLAGEAVVRQRKSIKVNRNQADLVTGQARRNTVSQSLIKATEELKDVKKYQAKDVFDEDEEDEDSGSSDGRNKKRKNTVDIEVQNTDKTPLNDESTRNANDNSFGSRHSAKIIEDSDEDNQESDQSQGKNNSNVESNFEKLDNNSMSHGQVSNEGGNNSFLNELSSIEQNQDEIQ